MKQVPGGETSKPSLPPAHGSLRRVAMGLCLVTTPMTNREHRHVLAGEWEYIDGSGAALRLILDAQGNGHYDWKDGRFETRTLIEHTW